MPFLGFGKRFLTSSDINSGLSGKVLLPSRGANIPPLANPLYYEGTGGYTGAFGDIGIVVAGGYNGSISIGNIRYVAISTTSAESPWGTLDQPFKRTAGNSNATSAMTTGGFQTNSAATAIRQFFSMASRGTTLGWGFWNSTNCEGRSRYEMTGVSSSTRGITGGGVSGTSTFLTFVHYSYTVFSSGGDYPGDFGNLTTASGNSAGTMSTTRAIISGGETTSGTSTARSEYITMATTGNFTNFGNLGTSRYSTTGVSSSTRGVIGGGNSSQSNMEYYTIASTGTGTSFGTLTAGRSALSGTSNSTRGVFSGGVGGTTTMDYITIATTGNATSFGTLTSAIQEAHNGQMSQSHGGI